MIARHLPIAELQAILTESQLRDVAALVCRLADCDGYDPVSDKEFLARLYDAYYGVDLFSHRSHRRRLLDFVPANTLTELGLRLGLPVDMPFASLADKIAGLPWGANEATAAFLDFFGYPSEYMPEPQTAALAQEPVAPFDPPLKVLQDYQSFVFFRARAALRPPCSRFMIQMPTGAGKTRTAMELVSAFINERAARRVLWLAHREELCEQAVESFREVWAHVGQTPVTLLRCWGNHSPGFPMQPSSFAVAGFQKLHSLQTAGCASPVVDLIVVDEAHKVLAPTFKAAVAWAKSPSARIVGLSATPGRGALGDEQNIALSDFFNEQIIGIETDGEGVIEYLQGRGVLARVVREPLHTNITFHLEKDEWEQLEAELDYPSGFLKRLAENHERNRIIVERLWQLAEKGAQVLVFSASLEQSRLLCAMMLYRKVPAAHVDGSTSSDTRRAVIAKFRRGDIRFLFNYEVFSTGFDAPNIDVVFIARPTKSLVLYSQMLGRGLRGPAMGGTHVVRLVDVVDNIVDFSGDLDEVYDYFSEYWAT